jgi:hypothetical protein
MAPFGVAGAQPEDRVAEGQQGNILGRAAHDYQLPGQLAHHLRDNCP